MRLLLDTHVWLWMVASPERLRVEVRELLAREENTVLLSAISSLEIAIKHQIGRLALPEPPAEFVSRRLVRDAVTPLPVEHAHALHVAELPRIHRDPFDRLLVAQSVIEAVPVVTADPVFDRYGVETIRAG